MTIQVPARDLARARDLVDARYWEPLDVPMLARAARMSKAHFSREFKSHFGETPHQYLLTRRLERAAALLRSTDRTVTDICLNVGLRSLGSFTTSFGRTFGMSPLAYRESHPPASRRARIPACVVLHWGRPASPISDRAVIEKSAEPRPGSVTQMKPSLPTDTHISVESDDEARPTVRFERHLDHSVQRVWQALTDHRELTAWYATKVRITPEAGTPLEFEFPSGHTVEGEVLRAEPQHLLEFTTRGDILRWELTPTQRGCLLVLLNTDSNPDHIPYTAAGFHITLEQLATLLDRGADAVDRWEMPPPDDLVAHYRGLSPR